MSDNTQFKSYGSNNKIEAGNEDSFTETFFNQIIGTGNYSKSEKNNSSASDTKGIEIVNLSGRSKVRNSEKSHFSENLQIREFRHKHHAPLLHN